MLDLYVFILVGNTFLAGTMIFSLNLNLISSSAVIN